MRSRSSGSAVVAPDTLHELAFLVARTGIRARVEVGAEAHGVIEADLERGCRRFKSKSSRRTCAHHPWSAPKSSKASKTLLPASQSVFNASRSRNVLLYADRATFYNPVPGYRRIRASHSRVEIQKND